MSIYWHRGDGVCFDWHESYSTSYLGTIQLVEADYKCVVQLGSRCLKGLQEGTTLLCTIGYAIYLRVDARIVALIEAIERDEWKLCPARMLHSHG